MATNIVINDDNTFHVAGKSDYRTLTVPFDVEKNDPRTFYTVKVMYRTGDSNGWDNDLSVEYIMVYDNEDVAFDCMDKIVFHHNEIERINEYGYKPTKEEKNFNHHTVIVPLQEIGDNKLPIHVSWEGYFERLNSIEIVDLVFKDNGGRKRKVEF